MPGTNTVANKKIRSQGQASFKNTKFQDGKREKEHADSEISKKAG